MYIFNSVQRNSGLKKTKKMQQYIDLCLYNQLLHFISMFF